MKIKTKHIICCIKCLFLGLVMALPFIAVLPTALYYGFNQNAESGDKVEFIPTNKVNTIDDLIIGNEYYIEGTSYNSVETLVYNYVDKTRERKSLYLNINLIQTDSIRNIDALEEEKFDYNFFVYGSYIDEGINIGNEYIEKYTITGQEFTQNYYYVLDLSDYTIIMTEELKELAQFTLDLYGSIEYTFWECPQEYRTIKSVETNISNQNALEIAFNNVFTTKGFNWVSNSIIATPIYAFVGAFGLTNDLFLSNLIVYWTNILLIYAILNIVIVCFTKLTTLGQKKDKD